jgi:hypothetical protein
MTLFHIIGIFVAVFHFISIINNFLSIREVRNPEVMVLNIIIGLLALYWIIKVLLIL